MRTLYVLRHGEAAPGQGAVDRDRELTAHGLLMMQKLAPLLESMDVPPTTALVSPAQRTRQSYRAAAPALPVQVIEDMYDAPVERLYHFVQGIDDSHKAALVVGHNPGIHQLVMLLARGGDPQMRARAAAEYKPGTLAVLRSGVLRWEAVTPDNTELIDLLVPPFAA
jgi:phosphohistidine phosphatase